MGLLAFVILGVALFGIGGNLIRTSPHDTVVKVNGQKITQARFDQLYQQIQRQMKEDLTGDARKRLTSETLNELIRIEVFDQEATKYDIHLPDQELQLTIASYPAFQTQGKFDPNTYYKTVYQVLGTTPKAFEEEQRKNIAGRKMNFLIASAVQIPDDQVTAQLPQRLAIETDKKKVKELKDTPEIFKNELRQRDVNLVMQDWLAQMNSTLKVTFVSETFKKRLSGAAE